MRQQNRRDGRNHFSGERWSDFVRGLGDEAERREIEDHLGSGCSVCRAAADRFAAVAQLAAADTTFPVPDDLVQKARQLFEPAGRTGWISSLEKIGAELISSARADWQFAGVRSIDGNIAGAAGDRMLFRAGDYSIDLKLDPPSAGEAGEIIGQITNERDRGENMEDVLVQMVVFGQTLGETATNRFGEFLMEYPAKKSATLRFALQRRGKRIDLSLKLHNKS